MPATSVRSILVIDDDQDDFEMVKEVIADIDPAISVSFINRYEDAGKSRCKDFDLVLLDINMPSKDGFFWLSDLRESGCDTPIIMYTNSSRPAHITKAYGEGATLYFTKPETYPQLRSGLRNLLLLDWSNPLSIKNRYVSNGECKTFQPI